MSQHPKFFLLPNAVKWWQAQTTEAKSESERAAARFVIANHVAVSLAVG